MQVQLLSDVPVFSAVLTPHNYHEHEDHLNFFVQHFVEQGTEVARACLKTVANLENVAAGGLAGADNKPVVTS